MIFVASELYKIMEGEFNRPTVQVVEFCAGSGFVALPFAALHPHSFVTLVDIKVTTNELLLHTYEY